LSGETDINTITKQTVVTLDRIAAAAIIIVIIVIVVPGSRTNVGRHRDGLATIAHTNPPSALAIIKSSTNTIRCTGYPHSLFITRRSDFKSLATIDDLITQRQGCVARIAHTDTGAIGASFSATAVVTIVAIKHRCT
jgi:hypothetical protein